MNNTSIFTNTIESLNENIDENLDESLDENLYENLDDEEIDEEIYENIDKEINIIEKEKNKISYEWESLSEDWIEKIVSDKFFIKTDCCTISIESALSNSGFRTSKNTLCKYISKYINKLSILEFSQIIKEYRLKYKNSINIGNWDPYVITNKKDFIKIIKGKEFFFQPDETSLYIISKSLEIDILLLSDNNYSIFFTDNKYHKIITLYSIKSNDFNLDDVDIDSNYYFPLGLKMKKKMKTIFLYSEIHKYKELLVLLDKKELLTQHTLNAIKKETNFFRLNDIIDYIENKIKSSSSKTDQKIIFKELNNTILQ